MAKHRTRAQKLKTTAHRGAVRAPAVPIAVTMQVEKKQSYIKTSELSVHEDKRPSPIPPTTQSLLRVDKSYLVADLRRSLVVSGILIAILIGIFLLVRYNGLTGIQSQFYSITQSMGE